jgi:diguanylate cyclase
VKNQFHIVTISFVLLICIITITNLINISDFYVSLFILGTSFVGLFFTINETKKNNILVKKLSSEAMHDGMTGLLNHRYFEKRLNEKIERSERYQQNFSLLFLDLDKFKRINDTYGHQFGDHVLKQTSKIIQKSVRNIDVVSRYGGEEFSVILVNANRNDAHKTAERIRKEIEFNEFIDGDVKEKLTISIGIGIYPTDANNFNGIISFSDRKMYKAKNDGRNCIR